MAQLKITSRMISSNPNAEEAFHRSYNKDGNLVETRLVMTETDYYSGAYSRVSPDNGRTWGEWVKEFEDEGGEHRTIIPGNEFGDEFDDGSDFSESKAMYHAQSGCYVCAGSSFYIINGRRGYYEYWEKGEDTFRWHSYFSFKRPDGTVVKRMFEFEEGGEDYDPAVTRNPAFLDKNRAAAERMYMLPDGDLIVVLCVNMRLCCRMAGVDVNTFFPSCPDLHNGVVMARGHWNPDKGDFEFTYSNPVMVSDLQSTRGFMEHQFAVLESGRILMVFRGSNAVEEGWNTRISPCAPSFKWFSYSDDGGRTFTPAMPWHFDTREVVYSPASIAHFFRSKKNGKLYWIGNYISEPWKINGNDPRNILHICQVDETHGYLIKDTLTVIDTIREGQTDVELSNFNLLENKETLELEVRLAKIDFNGELQEQGYLYSEAWEYIIHFD
ncbi:MAG: exo-alpha-sialidase [Ruminococcaceae bacterium]|nr:exo-alpha-sialidase [Oscillospiraceae bacterium]